MLSVFDGLRDVTTLSVFVRLACALICGGIIGIERSYKRRPAGFRTHILICIGAAITTLTSQYLYLNMHYLDLALSSFGFEADPTLSSVATDGFVIYYRPEWVFAMYKRGRVHINRAFLHMVFHCLFCHLDTRGKRAKDYWNLACDIAMESVIDHIY